MRITTIALETYEPAAASEVEATAVHPVEIPARSQPPLPKLFWAGVALFIANVVVLGSSALSPELTVSLYGDLGRTHAAALDRPSPFTEVVDTATPRKLKLAERVTPIFSQEPVAGDGATLPE